jgi:hypothetical protein
MPNRPSSHVISDKAVAQVMSIVASCEFAAEAVHKDYGEDLLVQTKLGSDVDPHRMWIQVKGTENPARFITQRHGMHLKISEDHAFRWLRSTELVVVVLWDVVKNQGWWSLPSRSLSEWEVRVESPGLVRLPFPTTQLFDVDALLRLAWVARIEHYHSLVVRAEAANEEAARWKREHSSLLPLICFDFLRLLDIVQEEGLSELFMRLYRNGMRKRFPDWDESRDGPQMNGVLTLVLLHRVDEVCKGGLPGELMYSCVHMLARMITDSVDPQTGRFIASGARNA